MREINSHWTKGPRSSRQDNVITLDMCFLIDLDRMGIDQSSFAVDHRHVVAFVKRLPHRHLLRDDGFAAGTQLSKGRIEMDTELASNRVVHGLHRAVDREPKSLAGNRPPMRAATTDLFVRFNDGNSLAPLGGLHRSSLTTRPCADHYDIVTLFSHRVANSLMGRLFPCRQRRRCNLTTVEM